MSNSKNRFGLLLLALSFSLSFSLGLAQANAEPSGPLGFLPRTVRQELAVPDLQALQPTAQSSSSSAASPSTVISLIDALRKNLTHETIDQLETKNSGYNRHDNFGSWIVADSKVSCLDTRGQVLLRSRDSVVPLVYKDARNCNIVTGLWHDPYAGNDFKLAKAMQIDHVVPLKHAYITGAISWEPAKRCYYANFVHNDFHLLAVSGHENMSKSDKAPDGYLPPDETFQCQYVADWMKVKAIWQLEATDAEIAAIEKVIQDKHCAVSKLQMTEAEIDAERKAILESVPARCQNFGALGSPTLTEMQTQSAPPGDVPAVPAPAY